MKLRLGPVPDTSTTKMTVAIPAPLMSQLQRYCELHSKNFGTPVDAPMLVPMILDLFLKKDRAFQRAMRSQSSECP